MPDKQTGNTSQHVKAEEDQPIRYLDPGSLAKPIDMPRNQRMLVLVFVAIAALIGGLIINSVLGSAHSSSNDTSQEVEQIISETRDLNLPKLADYTINDADGIKTRLDNANIDCYDNLKNSDDELELVYIPDGMKTADVKGILSDGINSADATTAARYICGSWRLTGNFDNGVDLRVRYCDMSATTATAALKDAANSQGYTIKKNAKQTTDSAGNTSVSGTTTYQGTTYKWTISACDISNVYNVSGIPGSAQYVGIHLTSS